MQLQKYRKSQILLKLSFYSIAIQVLDSTQCKERKPCTHLLSLEQNLFLCSCSKTQYWLFLENTNESLENSGNITTTLVGLSYVKNHKVVSFESQQRFLRNCHSCSKLLISLIITDHTVGIKYGVRIGALVIHRSAFSVLDYAWEHLSYLG